MCRKIIRAVFMLLALLALTVLPHRPVSAAPSAVIFTVNSTDDLVDKLAGDGKCLTAADTCTLRAAVMEANRSSGLGATIVLPSGIYTLAIPASGADGEENGDLNLTAPASGSPTIIISGAGAGTTIIDANQIDRVFHVHLDRVATISDVTIRNGYLTGGQKGGGIINEGMLTISRAVISANHVAFYGGGIDNNIGAILTLVNSTLSQNTATLAGGAIFSYSATVKVSNSTIFENGSNYGGGVYAINGTLYVINSTISQNYANYNGGGIYKSGVLGLVALYNTTVIANDANHNQGQLGVIGGGVYSETGARFIVANTLIAGNTLFNSPINDCNGMLEVYGWNLLSDVTGCTFSGNGFASWGGITLNKIGPLQNNGGPTLSYALLEGSGAIDTTDDSLGCVDETGALLTTDQRGFPRPVGIRCDVGAFEYSPPRYVYLPLTLR